MKTCKKCQQIFSSETSDLCEKCTELSTVNRKPKPLIEGEDFYYENGLFVFTTKYHLDRGFCCNNGCKHCPY